MQQREIAIPEPEESPTALPTIQATDLAGRSVRVSIHVALSWAGGPVGKSVPLSLITPPSKHVTADALCAILTAIGYTNITIDGRREPKGKRSQ